VSQLAVMAGKSWALSRKLQLCTPRVARWIWWPNPEPAQGGQVAVPVSFAIGPKAKP
jgi:hypothetical protein